MDKPVNQLDLLYQLLRTENIKAFNEQREHLDTSEPEIGDFRRALFRLKQTSGVTGRNRKTNSSQKLNRMQRVALRRGAAG